MRWFDYDMADMDEVQAPRRGLAVRFKSNKTQPAIEQHRGAEGFSWVMVLFLKLAAGRRRAAQYYPWWSQPYQDRNTNPAVVNETVLAVKRFLDAELAKYENWKAMLTANKSISDYFPQNSRRYNQLRKTGVGQQLGTWPAEYSMLDAHSGLFRSRMRSVRFSLFCEAYSMGGWRIKGFTGQMQAGCWGENGRISCTIRGLSQKRNPATKKNLENFGFFCCKPVLNPAIIVNVMRNIESILINQSITARVGLSVRKPRSLYAFITLAIFLFLKGAYYEFCKNQ